MKIIFQSILQNIEIFQFFARVAEAHNVEI